MKRTIFPITLILIAALFLSACGTAGTPVDGTPGIPQTGETATVDTMPTEAATTAATMAETEQATATTDTGAGAATATPSTDATTPAAGTATETTGGMTGTSTPSTGAGTTTETAPVPVTGTEESFVRLSTLLNGTVSGSDGASVGTLAGVLIQHPEPPAAEEEETSATLEASPTPAPTLSTDEMAFTVRYVLVDVSGSAGSTSGTGASATETGDGRLVIVPWQAFDFNTVQAGSATLGVEGTAVSGAPRFSLPDVASPSGAWFGQMNSYWADQNLTGFASSDAESFGEANLSLITRDFRDMAIHGPNDEDFGQVSDLLIDPETGEVMYAVFTGGADLNNQVFVVPLNLLEWSATEGGTQLGSFTVTVPTEMLQESPLFQSLEDLTIDPNTVQELQDFWQTVTP